MQVHRYLYLLFLPFITGCNATLDTNSEFGLANTFVKLYGNETNHVGVKALPTADGGYIFAGNTQVEGNLITQTVTGKMFLVKTDILGNKTWEVTDTAAQSIATNMVIDADGNYVLAGVYLQTLTNGSVNQDIRLAKVNPAGEVLWAKNYGDLLGIHTEFASRISIASNGDYLVIGHTTNTPTGGVIDADDTDMYALRIQAIDGAIIWQKIYGASTPFSDEGVAIVEDQDGNILWFGHADVSTAGGQRMRLIKSNSEGNVIWDVEYPLSSDIQTAGDLLVGSGGYTMVGTINDQYIMIETNKDGQMIWNRIVSEISGKTPIVGSLSRSSDGKYLIAGAYQFTNSISEDILLMKLGDKGIYEWHEVFGAAALDLGRSAIATEDGGILLGGTLGFESNSLMMMIKTDNQGKVSD